MSSVDRNAPCPCGSGKKYKKCCAWKDATATAATRPVPAQSLQAAAPTLRDDDFIAELKPDVDEAADLLLHRIELGQLYGVKSDIAALYRKHPDYHMTNYAMGVGILAIDNDPAAAIPFFQEAVRIFPPLVEAHYNLGSACFTTCRPPEAVAAFRDAIRYAGPDDRIAKMAKDQIRELERVLTKNSPFKTIDEFIQNQELFDRAFEHLRNEEYREGAELFGEVLKKNPKHVQSHGNLGLCYASLGRKAEALASLNRALELDPRYEPALDNKKVIEQMAEGVPFGPEGFEETEYYRERWELKKGPRKPGSFISFE